FSPDSRTLAMEGYDRVLRFWDVRSGALKNTISNGMSYANSLAFTADGTGLMVSDAQSLGVWDVATGRLRNSPTGEGVLLCVSPDGRWSGFVTQDSVSVREFPTLKSRSNLI